MSRRVQRPVSIETAQLPLPDPRPYVPGVTLPCNREDYYVSLHAHVAGFLMHWVDNKPYPHCREHDWCAGCRLGQTPRWQGYLGVINVETKNRWIMCIGAAAFRDSGYFRDASDKGQLAGVIFTGYRFGRGKSKNRPAVIEVAHPDFPVPTFNSFNLLAALSRSWNVESLKEIEEVRKPEESHKHMGNPVVSFIERLREAERSHRGAKP